MLEKRFYSRLVIVRHAQLEGGMTQGEAGPASKRQQRTRRFALRREQIIVAASSVINRLGAQGLTFAAVAKPLGLDTSSIIYYFPTKDSLTAACLERTLEELGATAEAAGAELTPRDRTRAFLHRHLAFHARQRSGEMPEFAVLSDMRGLPDELRTTIDSRYLKLMRTVRSFFDPSHDEMSRVRAQLAATLLLTNIHWIPGWIGAYDLADFPRVEQQLFRLLDCGLGIEILPARVKDPDEGSERPQTAFMRAATRLINAHGYRGASVERIAAELGFSTGTFYYHNDNKDDLVVACFERGFGAIREAGRLADDQAGVDGRRRLSQMLGILVALQLRPDSPVMRISAYQALPGDLRDQMLLETARITHHIAALVFDGIDDGSLPAIDPLIAAHAVIAAIEAAAALRWWQERRQVADPVASLLELVSCGLFVPPRAG